MSDELKKLHEEVATTFESLKEYNDKAIKEAEARGGEATAETREQVTKVNDELTELRKTMTEIEKRLNRPNMSTEGEPMDEETRALNTAFEKFLRYGYDEIDIQEKRALGGTSDSDGGFLIPPSFESGIIMEAFDLAALRPVCQVGTTGRDLVVLGALSKPTVAWGRQSIAVSQQSLDTGGERIQIYDLRALTLISNNTLDDSDANIIGEMTSMFGMALAEAEDDAFAVGAGDDSPQGVVADARVQALYVASGIADALSDATHNGVDALLSCIYTPKSIYRRNGTWAFNSTTEAVIRTLKDGIGNYLWQPSVQAGKPATLLGRPIVNPEGMPDIGAGLYPIVFGDFRAGYKIRDRAGMTVKRLDERYAEYDQTGFLIKKRVGGQVTLAEAFCPVKISAS